MTKSNGTSGHTLSPVELGAIETTLKKAGIIVKNNTVSKKSLKKLFGATMKTPEWVVLHDYTDDVSISHSLVEHIQNDLTAHRRMLLPASLKYAKFGEFIDANSNIVVLHGLVFQYAIESSPRNICFGYKLFDGDNCLDGNNGIATFDTAKQECVKAASDKIADLYDL